jgi:23S rRNA (adenine2503-C2)-methyltransferase
MPVTKTNPLHTVKEALRYYQRRRQRRITLEAVLLGGINTRAADIRAFADFAQGLDAVANLIPWNQADGMAFNGRPLQRPSKQELQGFAAGLENRGVKVTVRLRKGRRIAGACGQLGGSDSGVSLD